MKNDFVIRLCEVVQSMYKTVIMEISGELIFNWWYQLKIVQHGGIRTDFAFNHLKSIVQYHYTIVHERDKDSDLYQLYVKKVQHIREIDEQTAKLEEHKKQLEEDNKQIENIISSHPNEKSRRQAESLSFALELEMKKAGEGFTRSALRDLFLSTCIIKTPVDVNGQLFAFEIYSLGMVGFFDIHLKEHFNNQT